MSKVTNEEKTTISDVLIPLVLLAVSYGILFLLPYDQKFYSWIILAVSVFLFCLGFFWLGGVLSDLVSERILTPALVLFGAALLVFGFTFIYIDEASGRSMTTATLFLIQGIMIFAMASGDSGTERQTGIIFRIVSIALVVFGVWLVMRAEAEHGSVEAATLMLITCILLWSMGGGDAYNKLNTQSKAVPGMKLSIRDLCSIFETVETPLGHAWIGKVQGIKGDCILFGPTQDGVFVYGFYQYGRFYVAAMDDQDWLDAEEADRHRIEADSGSSDAAADPTALSEIYRSMFASYAKTRSKEES